MTQTLTNGWRHLLYNVDNGVNPMLAQYQEMVLRAVRQLGPDCRANEVQDALTKLLGKEQAFGAIFTTLDRLTLKKFVKWEKGKPDKKRGGRAPRLYTITGDGARALASAMENRRLVDAFDVVGNNALGFVNGGEL